MCDWCFDEIERFATNFTKEAEGKFFCRVQCADSYTGFEKQFSNIVVYDDAMRAEVIVESEGRK